MYEKHFSLADFFPYHLMTFQIFILGPISGWQDCQLGNHWSRLCKWVRKDCVYLFIFGNLDESALERSVWLFFPSRWRRRKWNKERNSKVVEITEHEWGKERKIKQKGKKKISKHKKKGDGGDGGLWYFPGHTPHKSDFVARNSFWI